MKPSVKSFTIKFWPLILFLVITGFFFHPFLLRGQLPIPSDTIVGLYHPFRDFYAQEYPRGLPFKNFLITDPVRQQYPWRELSIDLIKRGQWPLWNPYSFSGTPLLANLQSAVFYPLNILFFILPFNLSWGILILSEPLLAGVFLYLYLRNLRLEKFSSFLGALSFSFSGFFVAWLEWGTVLHVGLWLPLVLLSIDKLFHKFDIHESGRHARSQKLIIWSIVFVLGLTSSFFAGHLQTFFYMFIFSLAYLFARWWQYGKNIKAISLFFILYSLFFILTAVQWLPMWQFINSSGRGLDQINWQKEGWFIPWQNLIQFLAPDFFGNPATLNYWGAWNYAEFVGYIGVFPLIFAFLAIFSRFDKKTLFFGSLFFLSLSFALPTPWAKLPYQWQIPFLATSQPTRLLFLTDFSLAILGALGLDWLLRRTILKNVLIIIALLAILFLGLWLFALYGPAWFKEIPLENFAVAKRNLILPTFLFIAAMIILSCFFLLKRVKPSQAKMIRAILISGLVGLTVFDLLRFGQKFTPFSKKDWLFPKTKTIEFLQNQEKPFRIMVTDRRIFPPNFSVAFRLESVEGYDPLYLARYAELIAASSRKEPNILPPLGFNRIITPQNFESRIMDLLNVKYVLSLNELKSAKLKPVFQEGQTRIYENLQVLPRVFLTHEVKMANSKQEAINLLFNEKIDLRKTAIIEEQVIISGTVAESRDEVKIVEYREQKIAVETKSDDGGMLVIAQNFYPGWQAFTDGSNTTLKTYRVDYTLLGVMIPAGEHKIILSPSL